MKKKRTLFQSIKKDILKGFSRIKWLAITNFNYYIRKIFFKRQISYQTISLLIPSKQRVQKLNRLIESLKTNTNNLSRLHILILIDENEKDKQEYLDYVEKLNKSLNIMLFIKDEATHNKRNNYLASKIESDLYFPMNDDVVFIMKNWDLYIDEISSFIPKNKPYSIWNKTDRKYPYLHSDFPIVNNLWYKKLGYIGNLHLFGYIDTWICELGKLTKMFIVSKKKFIDHLNVENSEYSAEKDKTYHDLMVYQSNDYNNWVETKKIRIEDAKKLL